MTSFQTAFLSLLALGAAAQTPVVRDGHYRGVFQLAEGHEAPFQFDLKGNTAFLLNAGERLELKSVRTAGDSVFIPIDLYDNELAAKINKDGVWKGTLRKTGATEGTSFTASVSPKYRFFEKPAPATVSLHGKWTVKWGKTDVVGVFRQVGNKVTGTFLATTGDFRYWEGQVQGDAFFLSSFSGSGPSLIHGRISGNELTGDVIGSRGKQPLSGSRNEQAALPDAYTLTKAKEGVPLAFTFPNLEGKPVSLKDPGYKGKVVIVTILGSWCPNCIDEASFLAPWYRKNRKRGVEIIGLSFERKNDLAFAKTRLEPLKKRFGVDYELLFAGPADKKYASQVLPALSEVLAFPTTIYVDRNGNIAKIHTGYSGPATGSYYEAFVREFNEDIDELLKAPATAPQATARATAGK